MGLEVADIQNNAGIQTINIPENLKINDQKVYVKKIGNSLYIIPFHQPWQSIYKFDTQSLLNYYKGIFTNSALERVTGINQKQLQHYSTGIRKPRPAQTKKIQTALHKLGNELVAIEL